MQNVENEELGRGFFTGTSVVTQKGTFQVPENYISKSRLVEGDELKVFIKEGRILFKQIRPVPRKAARGIILRKDNKCNVIVGDSQYKIISASARFFSLESGDEVMIQLPAEEKAEWAVVTYVIKRETEIDREMDMN